MLEQFEQKMYGEYGCSTCGNPLDGFVYCVGEDTDEEGYEWRTFCPDCWSKVEEMPFEDIYKTYKPAQWLGGGNSRMPSENILNLLEGGEVK